MDYLINDQQKTPKGLLFLGEWGSLRLAAHAALIMLQVNKHSLMLSIFVTINSFVWRDSGEWTELRAPYTRWLKKENTR